MEWKRDEVRALIDFYQLYPCLWNCKLSDYKNRELRDLCQIKIFEALHQINDEITIVDVKKKIQTLRGQYKREQKIVRESRKCGTGTDNVRTPKLWCFNRLQFLEEYTSLDIQVRNL